MRDVIVKIIRLSNASILVWLSAFSNPAIALNSPTQSPDSFRIQNPSPIRPRTQCPETLEELIPLLLRDLPSYANRVAQRSFDRIETPFNPGYVLLAGQVQYEPLTLGPGEYRPTLRSTEPPQVFFTTLERQYVPGRSVMLQHYHWLFITRADDGWRLVSLYSAIGQVPDDEPPTPPQNTTFGAIGQAIQLWLRDCRAGAINGGDRGL